LANNGNSLPDISLKLAGRQVGAKKLLPASHRVFAGKDISRMDRICRTPEVRMGGEMKQLMNKQQLEITLPTMCRRPGNYRQRRVSRARWWFSQMRRVVDEAVEWAPAVRQEQAKLPPAGGR
jgi:hypothetical protein